MVVSGILGALTNIFHGLYMNMKYDFKGLLVRFVISILAICPAYLFCEYMGFERNLSFIVGYISGALGDRLINELYRREKRIYEIIAGPYDEETSEEDKKEQ